MCDLRTQPAVKPCASGHPSRQHHGQRSGGAATTPGPGLRAGMPADGGVLAGVIVPYDRLGHGVPHGRPGLGHRPCRCAGPPRASGPLPGSQTPGLVLLGRGLSPPAEHCGGSARPPALTRPSRARAIPSCGFGAAGLPRPWRWLAWARGGAPRHAGSCSSGSARSRGMEEGGFALCKKKPRPGKRS